MAHWICQNRALETTLSRHYYSRDIYTRHERKYCHKVRYRVECAHESLVQTDVYEAREFAAADFEHLPEREPLVLDVALRDSPAFPNGSIEESRFVLYSRQRSCFSGKKPFT